MRYEGTVYRPPSEANSILIQATIGCPHNRCAFCAMYKDKSFRIRPVEDIKADLDMAKKFYGDDVESIFFPDGNSIFMKTSQMTDIFGYCRQLFPRLERITLYGSAKFIHLKSQGELEELRKAGLSRIHSGMESGDDVTLDRICKGSTAEEIIEAGRKVKAAGIEQSEYLLIGIGGRSRSREHAIHSARVLSAIDPDYIRLRTFIPMPNTPLYQDWRNGTFQLLSPHEALKETRLFLEHLQVTGLLYSDHHSNYAYINGKLPESKPQMLAAIEHLLTLPEEDFRPPEDGSL